MKNNINVNLIEALKKYNKSFSETINGIISLIKEIDQHITHQRKLEKESHHQPVSTSFTRDNLLEKVQQSIN